MARTELAIHVPALAAVTFGSPGDEEQKRMAAPQIVGPDQLHHPTAVAATGLRWSARAGPGVGLSRGFGGCMPPCRRGVRSRFAGNPGAILDIGCGNGGLLYLARKEGWRVRGMELTEKAACDIAEGRGIGVIATTIPTTRRHDVVVLRHVLEHLPDPARRVIHPLRGIQAVARGSDPRKLRRETAWDSSRS